MIPLPSAEQIRAADAYTIQHEPISSIDLMERASGVFTAWYCDLYGAEKPVLVLCGMGNNGGDGLCIARMLHNRGYDVAVFVLEHRQNGSPDFQYNLARLRDEAKLAPVFIDSPEGMEGIGFTDNTVLIDALWGSGLNRPLEGLAAALVEKINSRPADMEVVAVDIPSGLSADGAIREPAVTTDRCLSFEFPKRAFVLPQSGELAGEWEYREIGLHPAFVAGMETIHYLLEPADCRIPDRRKFSHKGTYGHTVIVGGEPGKQGAAYLAAAAALRSGCGLVSVQLASGTLSFNAALPEIMHLAEGESPSRPHVAVLGPGLGTSDKSLHLLKNWLEKLATPVVLDADALNLLAENSNLWQQIPRGSILTPHPGEFDRLFPEAAGNPQARLETAKTEAAKRQLYLLIKGANTCIATPDGKLLFNATGNPGMATAGSGDVLSGIIGSLLAQGLAPEQAAKSGTWLHGLAGDFAAVTGHPQSLIASDLIENLALAFKQLEL